MEHYKTWKSDDLEIRNYGGNTYNVYYENNEVDCFTLYNKEIEQQTIIEYFKEQQI